MLNPKIETHHTKSQEGEMIFQYFSTLNFKINIEFWSEIQDLSSVDLILSLIPERLQKKRFFELTNPHHLSPFPLDILPRDEEGKLKA